ncbi:MAG: ribosome maturation factor RimP [Thermacetogeniaceae bacterium]
MGICPLFHIVPDDHQLRMEVIFLKKQSISDRVTELITPFILQEGLELVDVEYQKDGPNWFLRIFIDKPGGVRLDDCEMISNIASSVLDKVDIIPQKYYLEVSSPGVERPLKKPEDFERFRGSKITVRTKSKIQGSRNFQGVLVGYEDDQVVLETTDGLLKIPFHLIGKARLKVF